MLSFTSPRMFQTLAFSCSLLVFSCCSFFALPLYAQETAGPYRLIGTIKGKEVSGAVLIDSAGNQTFYRVREKLPDGSRITKIQDDVISVKREDGTLYDLYIVHDANPSSKPAFMPAAAPARHAAPAPVQAQEATPLRGGPEAGYQGYSGESPGAISGDPSPGGTDRAQRAKSKRRAARRQRPDE